MDGAIATIQALLSANPEWVVAALDASDAYGSIHRKATLQALASLSTGLGTYVHQCLQHAVHGVVSGEDGTELVQNLEGVL